MCRAAPVVADRKSFEASYDMEGVELGRGFSGAVCAAVCKLSGKEVAVKTYRKDQLGHKEMTYMRSEIAIHEKLSHSGIVSLHEVFETLDCVHLVMERLHGGELFDQIISTGGISEGRSAKIASQLLQSLAYLHDQHIVHRDVKPENVVFESEGGNAKLIDFGFATIVDPQKKLTWCCGTPQYTAPEMLEGLPYDERVDVWSTGVCLYTMLTGCKLVVDGGEVRFGAKFPKLSAEAQDFVKALLRVDPEERLSARKALEHPWLAKHVPAQKHQAPPKPESKHSLLWQTVEQAVPATLLHVLKFGALGLCAANGVSANFQDMEEVCQETVERLPSASAPRRRAFAKAAPVERLVSDSIKI